MPRLEIPERHFEEFLANLLKRFGMVVIEYTPWDRSHGYDLKVRTPQNNYAIVEVRLDRTLHIDGRDVRRTIDMLVQMMARVGMNVGILVTNSRISEPLKNVAKTLGVIVYDFDVLNKLVEYQPDLSEQWERLSQEGFIYRSDALPPPVAIETIDLITLPETISTSEQPPREAKGDRLCNDLRSLKAGQVKPATRFEENFALRLFNIYLPVTLSTGVRRSDLMRTFTILT